MLGFTALGVYPLGRSTPSPVTYSVTADAAGAAELFASVAAHYVAWPALAASSARDLGAILEATANGAAHSAGIVELSAGASADTGAPLESNATVVFTADTAAQFEALASAQAHGSGIPEFSAGSAGHSGAAGELSASAAGHVPAQAEEKGGAARDLAAPLESLAIAAFVADTAAKIEFSSSSAAHVSPPAESAASAAVHGAAPIESAAGIGAHAAGQLAPVAGVAADAGAKAESLSGIARHIAAGLEFASGMAFHYVPALSSISGVAAHLQSLLSTVSGLAQDVAGYFEGLGVGSVPTGKTYYVSPPLLAVETGAGTQSNPFRTWYYPQRVMVPGDTLFINGGTYGAKLYIGASGAPGAYLTFKGDPNNRPLIRETSGHACEIQNGESWIRVTGLDVNTTDLLGSGFYNEAGPLYSHHIIVDSNIFHDCPSAGIQINRADYVAVTNNICYGNAKTSNLDTSGISVFQPANVYDYATGYHIVVAGNLCYDNANYVPKPSAGTVTDGNGIICDDFDHIQGGFASIYPKFLSKSLVANNICVNNGGSGVRNYMSSQVDILNNIIWGNAQNPAGTRNADLMVHVYGGSDINVNGNISVCNSVQGQYQHGRGGEEYSLDGTPTGDAWGNNILFSDASGVAEECTSSPGFAFAASNLVVDPVFANPTRFSGPGTTYAQALAAFTPTANGITIPATVTLPAWATGGGTIATLFSDPLLISLSFARSLLSASQARTLSALSTARNLISRI